MKQTRQSKIIELIEEQSIERQEDLAVALWAAGFQVTQATVSRDIKKLHLTKVAVGTGKKKYALLKTQDVYLNDKYLRVLRDDIISMDKAQNILVIKTVPGMAMAVAAALDAMTLDEIVGSIAGDDTIMAAVRSVEDTTVVIEKIQNMIQ
ncbi:MAG: arginine repressor [Lachnospiraceae bacterium]